MKKSINLILLVLSLIFAFPIFSSARSFNSFKGHGGFKGHHGFHRTHFKRHHSNLHHHSRGFHFKGRNGHFSFRKHGFHKPHFKSHQGFRHHHFKFPHSHFGFRKHGIHHPHFKGNHGHFPFSGALFSPSVIPITSEFDDTVIFDDFTTLGENIEAKSNLEINSFGKRDPKTFQKNVREFNDNTDEIVNIEDVSFNYESVNSLDKSSIYTWKDANGVKHYTNYENGVPIEHRSVFVKNNPK